MMKNAIRLLVLAGALLSVGALAQSTQFNFSYPDYFYVFTNLASEKFDFTATAAGSNPGTATGTYGPATKNSFDSCLDTLLASAPASVTAQGSMGSNQMSGSCDFVATDTTKDSFSVDWGSTGETAEGAVLVATNKNSWAAAARIDSNFSQVANYVDLQLRTGSSTFSTLSASATNIGSLSGGSLSNAYYTNYVNIYVVPLQYKLVLTNPLAIPVIDASSPDTATVVYEAGTP